VLGAQQPTEAAMLRIIVRTDDANMAANCQGAAVESTFRTFDFRLPELEAFLREPTEKKWQCLQRSAIGIEILPPIEVNNN